MAEHERELAKVALSVTPDDFQLLKDIFEPAARARLAGLALVLYSGEKDDDSPQEIATRCVAVADAIIEELEK